MSAHLAGLAQATSGLRHSDARLLPAAILCLVALVGFELAGGAELGDALLYLGYLAGFVVLPGCLAYLALSPGSGPLRTLAFGSGLGYALSIFAFMGSAALGARDAYLIYPLVTVGVSLVVILRSSAGAALDPTGVRLPPNFGLGLAAVAIAAMGYLALAYFVRTPLPGEGTFGYFRDYIWHLSLAAELKHHWPIEDPHAVGAAQPYHYFVHIQMAAGSQVTGLDLPLVFFRLSPLPLVALVVLQLAEAGRSLLRSPWAGLIAACLLLLVGDLQMDPSSEALSVFPFLGTSFSLLFLSPSFLFGFVLFIPLLVIVGERVSSPVQPGPWREWLLIGLLALGAANAKVTLLPMLLGGLALFAAWSRIDRGRIAPSVLRAAAILAAVIAAFYVLLYSGHGSGLALDPFLTFTQMPAILAIKAELVSWLGEWPGRVFMLDGFGVVAGTIGLLGAQLVGLIWLIRRRGWSLRDEEAWLASMLMLGLATLFLLGAPGSGNQLYFIFLAMVPGTLLAAKGLSLAWAKRPPLTPFSRPLVLGAAVGLLAVLSLIALPSLLDVYAEPAQHGTLLLLRYAGLALVLLVLYVVLRRIARSRWPAAAVCTVLVIVVGALATPFGFLVPAVRGVNASAPAESRLTPGLHDALLWLREEVPFDENFAVNNDDLAQFNYSAFSEHRAYIEGWLYSSSSVDAGFGDVQAGKINPFADRLALNDAAFMDADETALETMREDYGVRYLVIDSVEGYAVTDLLTERYATAYSGPGIRILDLERPL